MQRCILFALAVCAVLVSGCAHYGYSHKARFIPVCTTNSVLYLLTGATNVVVKEVKDRTGSTMFFVMGKAAQIDSKTTDQDYSKTITIGGLEGKVDGDSLQKAFEGLGGAVGEAMRAYMGLPPLPVSSAPAATTPAATSLINSFRSGLIRNGPPAAVTAPVK